LAIRPFARLAKMSISKSSRSITRRSEPIRAALGQGSSNPSSTACTSATAAGAEDLITAVLQGNPRPATWISGSEARHGRCTQSFGPDRN
jgi:hypothetical protein